MKIVSLVPSLTELLFDIELNENILGRTRFCIHPSDNVSGVQIIGGTKNPNIGKIRAIKPDLVIANREENRREDVEEIRKFSKVHVTDISTVNQALEAIKEIGKITNRKAQAENLVSEIETQFKNKQTYKSKNAVYLIWKNPYMSIGRDTYLHDVMKRWHLVNVFEDRIRYPETSVDEIREINPDVILLSSEPYPFSDKHTMEFRELFPASKTRVVNGEWFSWYGSRMRKAFPELTHWRRELEQDL